MVRSPNLSLPHPPLQLHQLVKQINKKIRSSLRKIKNRAFILFIYFTLLSPTFFLCGYSCPLLYVVTL